MKNSNQHQTQKVTIASIASIVIGLWIIYNQSLLAGVLLVGTGSVLAILNENTRNIMFSILKNISGISQSSDIETQSMKKSQGGIQNKVENVNSGRDTNLNMHFNTNEIERTRIGGKEKILKSLRLLDQRIELRLSSKKAQFYSETLSYLVDARDIIMEQLAEDRNFEINQKETLSSLVKSIATIEDLPQGMRPEYKKWKKHLVELRKEIKESIMILNNK